MGDRDGEEAFQSGFGQPWAASLLKGGGLGQAAQAVEDLVLLRRCAGGHGVVVPVDLLFVRNLGQPGGQVGAQGLPIAGLVGHGQQRVGGEEDLPGRVSDGLGVEGRDFYPTTAAQVSQHLVQGTGAGRSFWKEDRPQECGRFLLAGRIPFQGGGQPPQPVGHVWIVGRHPVQLGLDPAQTGQVKGGQPAPVLIVPVFF